MATVLILFLLLITGGLAAFKYKKTSGVFFLLSIMLFLLVGTGVIPNFLLKSLASLNLNPLEPHWKNQNAIVLLGGGAVKLPSVNIVKPTIMSYGRIYEAERLYMSCKKSGNSCTLIISGGDAAGTGVSEAVAYQNDLLNVGVNPTDIQIEPKSLNTYKNAEFTSPLLKKKPFDQIILVTSGIHMKRALLYFSHFNIHAIPAPSDYISAHLSILPQGYNFAITDYALHEYGGIIRFYVYNFLGWNDNHSSAAGA